jgi:hypothetical protein
MKPEDLPLPQTGGAYIRDRDGTLKPEPPATEEASTSSPTSKKDKR